MAIIDVARLPLAGTWEAAGVEGGIPAAYPVGITVTDAPYSATGDGLTDDYAAIAAAIAACPVGEAVYFPAGTYLCSSLIRVNKGIVLRGAGSSLSILSTTAESYEGSFSIYRQISGTYSAAHYYGTPTAITGGTTRESTSITVASSAGMVVGNWLMVTGDNPDVVNTHNDENDGYSHTPAHGYFTRISVIDGTTITLEEGLPWTTTANRYAAVFNYGGAAENFVEDAGFEDLGFKGNGVRVPVAFVNAANCWMTGCDIFDGKRNNVLMWTSVHCTVHGNLIRDVRDDGSGGGYGLLMEMKSTQNLIENNRFNLNATSILIDWGAMGNVVSYNYVDDFIFFQSNWQVVQFSHHTSHAMFTLWEGNHGHSIMADDIHGSSSHLVAFRNRLHGDGGVARDNHLWCLTSDRNCLYPTVVGNLLGTTGRHTSYQQDSTTGIAYTTPSIYTLGFANFHYAAEGHDPDPATTAYQHGNYDVVNDDIVWDAGNADHTIPDSLYLASKPAWFGALDWPAYDPASPTDDSRERIPAGYLYANAEPPSAEAPSGDIDPVSQSVVEGATMVVSVANVLGTEPITYQWWSDGAPLVGETSSSYSKVVSLDDDGSYFICDMTNASGMFSTDQSDLTVTPATPSTGPGRKRALAMILAD